MLLRLVRPMRRKGSRIPYFVQRIPADIRAAAIGVKLALPIGNELVSTTITARQVMVKVSLRTAEPNEAKIRQAAVAAYLETVWHALRQEAPLPLSFRDATALAGRLYQAWAGGEGLERSYSVVLNRQGEWEPDFESNDDVPEFWEAASRHMVELEAGDNPADLEKAFGSIIDRLLLTEGIRQVDNASRRLLLKAFRMALHDAFESRRRNAEGDYRPDPQAERFPAFKSPVAAMPAATNSKQSLKGLVDAWWQEAQAAGRTVSTFESYRNTMARLVKFLGHDGAERVTPDDVIRFKDHRLAEGVSIKTIRDSDIAGLKSVFGWAVSNRRMAINPAEGVKLKGGRITRTRSQGFTATEAALILGHAQRYMKTPQESAKAAASKRWIPWLCAYTGARVGEIVQLRKEDVRYDAGNWIITITPEAGTVKDKEARDVVLHGHLVELGFAAFVAQSSNGYLFLAATSRDDIRGAWRGVKTRIAVFVREVVTDKKVAPNHGWRHTFKTVGREVGIEDSVLDGICGHAPSSVGGSYGSISVAAQVRAFAQFPRFAVE